LLDNDENVFATKHGIEVLWPLQDRRLSKPPRTLNSAAANAVVRAFLPREADQRFIVDIR
jgi:hypothetical protein